MGLFEPDYPGAITDFMVNPSGHGYYDSSGFMIVNRPKAIVLHTPEEPADDYESTPRLFATPGVEAGTHYYLDNDGDMFQLLPETYCPYANGNTASGPNPNRTWKGKFGAWPPWAQVGLSLNCQTLSVEMEGYAANFGHTVTDKQWKKLVHWIKHRAAKYNIPLDRDHIIGHFEVATDRTDPGRTFDWDRLMRDLHAGEEEVVEPGKIRFIPEGEPEVTTSVLEPDGDSEVNWSTVDDERVVTTIYRMKMEVTTKQRMKIVVDP